MFVRIPAASWIRWGRSSLVLALSGLPLYASCTKSEDTEPYVPAVEGSQQPEGDGDLIAEDVACERLRQAAEDAYDRLGCDAPELTDCPGFLRPGGGSGCYEYPEGSIAACEAAYEDAATCRALSPCIATAVPNIELPTCELLTSGEGGAGGAPAGAGGGGAGGADAGGAGNGEGGMNALPEGGNANGAGAGGHGGAG